MKRFWGIFFFGVVSFSSLSFGQSMSESDGFEMGPFILRPSMDVSVGYDDRASLINTNQASGDFYSDFEVGARINNAAARYDFLVSGNYGERYSSDLNDNFYNAQASLSSSQSSLQWGLSLSAVKSISYNTGADSPSGEGPQGILTDGTSRRYTGSAAVSYEKQLSDRTILTPSIGAEYYFQDFEVREDAEWKIYSAGFELAHAYSANTFITLAFNYDRQVNSNEVGDVGSLTVGARSRVTDKISWAAEIGALIADYEESGMEQGLTGTLRITWQITEKVSGYVFGDQDFQPGYAGGGARKTFRAGYGLGWQVTSRWSIQGQGLHDYEDQISDETSSQFDGIEHFYSVSSTHSITEKASISYGVNYANDEEEVDQTIVSIGLSLLF